MCCKVAVRRLAMCSRSMAKVTALLGKCLDKFAKNPVAGQACNRADCPSRLKEKATLAKGGPDKPCSSEHVATVTRQSLTRLLSAVSIDFAVAPLTFLAVWAWNRALPRFLKGLIKGLEEAFDMKEPRPWSWVKRYQCAQPADCRTWDDSATCCG